MILRMKAGRYGVLDTKTSTVRYAIYFLDYAWVASDDVQFGKSDIGWFCIGRQHDSERRN
jgi:hypothetical protein